jgi:hypothetical protein
LIHAEMPATSSSGLLAFTSLQAALPTDTKILAILSVQDSSNYDVEFLRHNNRGAEQRNYFTRPNASYVKYRVTKDGLLLSPVMTGVSFKVSVLRTPVPVSLETTTDCELPISAHEKIIAMAIDLAKFPSQDESVGGISQTTV